MKAAFYTLGCKVNQYETQSMREQLSAFGIDCADSFKDADIVIINSCTVTAESDRKTRQAVRRFRKNCPAAIIVLCGCVPAAFPNIADELPEADIIFSNSGDGKLPHLIKAHLETKERIVDINPHKKGEKYCTPSIKDFSERTRAFVKIEDGCDRFCSYCIIPTARGRVRSRSVEDIKTEVTALSQKGFCEVVLVGINLSAYGKDTGLTLCDAVSAVAEVDGIKRIRLGSLEPDHISEEMLIRLKAEEKFCPQFHLSLQSGCDATLLRMNRHYDAAFYRELVGRIRKIFPDCSITTDIMVGFAGETEEDFEASVRFAYEIGFAKAHIFSYSRRKGTRADTYDNQVESAVKAKRSQIMITECGKCEKKFIESQIGRIFPVLFEQYENGFCEGYTPNYTRVRVKSDKSICGQILDVKLLSREGECCIGEII